MFGRQSETAETWPDPMDIVDRLYHKRGCDAVFALARALGSPSGFDVISHVLMRSETLPELVRRWNGLVTLQASLRYVDGSGTSSFVMNEGAATLLLAPHRVRPANRKPFGPAMLAGVVTGTLESAGFVIEGIWSVPRGRAARPVFQSGFCPEDVLDFDSDLVIRLSGADKTKAKRSRPQFSGDFNHLLAPDATGASIRLITRVVDVLERAEGDHMGLAVTAAGLGVSSRSLSRRLSEAGIGYGRLARYVRLRKASRLLVGGATSLDDVAYLAAYSDRHHLSREFRKMAQVTPSGLRDLMAG
ncbi:helix-turn-helix domain-containing protein [Roseibium sediminicola]|uniref:AraC family transcriptional regulator n=1 Tax=Roseibium sediminicola TaxID=2933272 RepID=A0ABT0GQ75_9HYPH|nr:AraC family transcriptional regulator [Roseibium sp. CAU 1639]